MRLDEVIDSSYVLRGARVRYTTYRCAPGKAPRKRHVFQATSIEDAIDTAMLCIDGFAEVPDIDMLDPTPDLPGGFAFLAYDKATWQVVAQGDTPVDEEDMFR